MSLFAGTEGVRGLLSLVAPSPPIQAPAVLSPYLGKTIRELAETGQISYSVFFPSWERRGVLGQRVAYRAQRRLLGAAPSGAAGKRAERAQKEGSLSAPAGWVSTPPRPRAPSWIPWMLGLRRQGTLYGFSARE